MGRPVWISMGTAHRAGEPPLIDVWTDKPVFDAETGSMRGSLLTSICSPGVRHVTGLRLRPGETKRVRIVVTELLHQEDSMEEQSTAATAVAEVVPVVQEEKRVDFEFTFSGKANRHADGRPMFEADVRLKHYGVLQAEFTVLESDILAAASGILAKGQGIWHDKAKA